MTTQSESPCSFLTGEAVVAWRRVKLTPSRTVIYADAVDAGIGVTQNDAASGEAVAVRRDAAVGTSKMMASGAIAAGKKVYAAASGKIAQSGSVLIGNAVDAATADGSIIEVVPTLGIQQSSSSSSSSSST